MIDTNVVDVVISGIGGYFPEADNIDELKKNLFDGIDMITFDDRRWNTDSFKSPKGTGKCKDKYPFQFDTTFFGINKKAASMMDPLNRMFLEGAFEAIVDSGNNPSTLSGHNVGVFTNSNISELEVEKLAGSTVTGYVIMGASKNMFANRVSFYFNFVGPSCSYDNSWVGGIEVLKMATEQIQQGLIESALVIAGAVHTNPYTAGEIAGLATPQSPELCLDGKCRSFDEQACGFPRSEAIVALYLERMSDAKRNYGSIVHLDTFVFGNRNCAFIEIEQDMITKSLRQFYKECQVDPAEVAYVEADGSSVKRLDTVELNSLAEVFCPNRTSPLPIGSVKSNLGHTESANSLVALAKAIIVLETGIIPANLHYQNPNSAVPALNTEQIKVVTKHEPLQGNLVAVNTLSYCGTVGHLLIKRNDKMKITNNEIDPTWPQLILTSARHEEGMDKVNNLIKSMPFDAEFSALVNDVFKHNINGYGYRSYTLMSSDEEFIKQEKREFDYKTRPVWFIFSGMGSQWNGMGVGLMKIPVFAAAIEKCHKVLEPFGVDLKYILTSNERTLFSNILHSFVAIAAVQIGLVDILRSLGIVPDGMIGHSVGELGCAYADGCFTAEEMILSAYARGKSSLDVPTVTGLMAAVGLGYNDIKDKIPPTIQVACHNSATSCTLSGPTDDMNKFIENLKNEKIFVKSVNVSNIAYHSRYIAPIAPKLLQNLKKIITTPKRRSSKWISSSVPEADWGSEEAQYSSAEYHTNNLLGSVLFEEACRHIPEGAVGIEIAPHGLLQSILRRALPITNISLTDRSARCGRLYLLRAVGEMYLHSLRPDVNAIMPPVQFPVTRETPCVAQLVTWEHSEYFPSINDQATKTQTNSAMDLHSYFMDNPSLCECKVYNQFIVPTSHLLINIWTTLCELKGSNQLKSIVFKDVYIHKQLLLSDLDKTMLGWNVNKGTGRFEVLTSDINNDHNNIIMSGSISMDKKDTNNDIFSSKMATNLKITQNEFYNFFKCKGYQLSKQYMVVQGLQIYEKECIGHIKWLDWMSFLDGLLKVNEYLATMDSLTTELLMTSYIRKIKINTNNVYTHGNFQFVKKHSYNYLQCGGIEIHGAEYRELGVPDTQSNIIVEKLEFVPLACYFQQMDKFIETALQLIRGNSLKLWTNDLTKYVIYKIKGNNDEFLFDLWEKVVNLSSNVKVQCQSVIIDNLKSLATPHLIITSAENLNLCVVNSNANLFMCFASHDVPWENDDLLPVIQFKSDDLQVTLFRKIKVTATNVIENVKGSEGLSKLKEKVAIGQNVEKIIIKWSCTSKVEIWRICKTLAEEDYADRLCCFFILDEKAPKFTVDNPFYLRQISLGFAINIYKEGSWVCFNRIAFTSSLQLTARNNLFNMRMESMDLQYISIYCNKYIKEQSKLLLEAKYIDYSGNTMNGINVMGIAKYNQKNMRIEKDTILEWTVPKNFKLQDAATIPIAYAVAYFALKFCAKFRKGETVLVTAGYTAMGEAAIAVAQELGGDVYTTVSNKKETSMLLNKFSNLNPKHILHHNSNIDYELMRATNGKGMVVIFNTMSGNIYQTLTKCLASFAKFIQISQTEMEEKQQLGSQIFLKSISFYSIGVDTLFNLKDSWKFKLRVCVENGLKKNVVKPLTKNVISAKDAAFLTNYIMDDLYEEKNVIPVSISSGCALNEKKHLLKLLYKNSYLIVGNNDDLCLDIIEWLIGQGANNIVLSGSSVSTNGHIKYRINQLIRLFGVTVIDSTMEFKTSVQAHKLIDSVKKMGHLAAIFNIFTDDRCVGEGVLHLYSASKELDSCCFVSFLSRDYNIIPGTIIQYDSNPKAVIKYLDQVLDSQHPTNTIVVSDKDSGCTLEMLSQYLPTVDDLKEMGNSLKRPRVHEVCTKSPRARYLRKCIRIWSIFIFPGITYAKIEHLVRKLDYVSYYVHLPSVYQSIEKVATSILEEIQNVCDTDAYTFVSETWSGVIATEVARQLEARGKTVTLILLNAHPSNTQNWAKMFGQPKSAEFANNLLTFLLKPNLKTRQEVMIAKTWEDKLRCAMSSHNNKDKYVLGVTAFYNMLSLLLDFKPSEPFKGDVCLLRARNDNDHSDGTSVFYQKNYKSFMINDAATQSELINSKTTARIVNEQTHYSWF